MKVALPVTTCTASLALAATTWTTVVGTVRMPLNVHRLCP